MAFLICIPAPAHFLLLLVIGSAAGRPGLHFAILGKAASLQPSRCRGGEATGAYICGLERVTSASPRGPDS